MLCRSTAASRLIQNFNWACKHGRFAASPGLSAAALQQCLFSSTCSQAGLSTTSSPASRDNRNTDNVLPLHLQDQIVLKGMAFYGYHGAMPEENVLGQRFVVDATLWADLSAAGCSDSLHDTIDYSKAYSTVRQVVEGPGKQLQEAVVEEVCQRLLGLDKRVAAVQVYMRKPHVALGGVLDSVGVQMFRSRKP